MAILDFVFNALADEYSYLNDLLGYFCWTPSKARDEAGAAVRVALLLCRNIAYSTYNAAVYKQQKWQIGY